MAKTALASHVSDEGEVVCVERWVTMTKESPPPRIRATAFSSRETFRRIEMLMRVSGALPLSKVDGNGGLEEGSSSPH